LLCWDSRCSSRSLASRWLVVTARQWPSVITSAAAAIAATAATAATAVAMVAIIAIVATAAAPATAMAAAAVAADTLLPPRSRLRCRLKHPRSKFEQTGPRRALLTPFGCSPCSAKPRLANLRDRASSGVRSFFLRSSRSRIIRHIPFTPHGRPPMPMPCVCGR